MALYHLYALLQERPEELERAEHFLMMPDLFNYFLTGKIANEYTNGTMTLLVDQIHKKWQDKIIRPLGIPEKIFSDMVFPGNILGPIQDSVCEQYSFPKIPVINVASHDTASAIAGLPIEDENQIWAFISLGTWAIFGIETNEFYNSESVFESGFGTQGGCEGKNNFVNLVSGLWVIQQCHELWESESDDGVGWDLIVSEAEKAKPLGSIIPLDDEHFVMPHANMPEVIADYCKKTGQNVPNGMGETARCVFEGLVLKMRDCYENIVKITGKDIDVLHIVGGGSKNKLLCQWIADATGVLIKAGPSETTSVGNLLLQMKGTGEIKNLSEGRRIAASSIDVKTYVPREKQQWDVLYQHYQAFIKLKKEKG